MTIQHAERVYAPVPNDLFIREARFFVDGQNGAASLQGTYV